MTPDSLRSARKVLGLTQHGLADALRMGKWGFQSVAKWEKGETAIPGPAAVAVELLVAMADLGEIERLKLGPVSGSIGEG